MSIAKKRGPRRSDIGRAWGGAGTEGEETTERSLYHRRVEKGVRKTMEFTKGEKIIGVEVPALSLRKMQG